MAHTLITGASSGIGEEFARQLAAKRHDLILIARSVDKLDKLADELKNKFQVDVRIFAIDLATDNSAEKVFEECQKANLEVNFLINDAGIGLIGKFDNFELPRIQEMLLLNVVTLTKLTYLFMPQLKKHKGTLINLASQIAFSPAPYMAAYAGTKAYVLSFTEAIHLEFEKENVQILALCPGPTYTRFFERTQASPDTIKAKFRPPKDVVEEAFNALKSKKSTTVVGWENKAMICLFRFLPRSLLARIAAKQVKHGETRPN